MLQDQDEAGPTMDNIDRPFDWAGACTAVRDAPVVRIADGASVRLRAASTDEQDDDAFRRLFFTLRDSTRYLYFCAGIPANAMWAERFVSLGHTDGDRSYVLAAEVGNELIGFARFSQNPHTDPHTTEIGIILTDAWQCRGLGGHMLCRLAAEAQAREVTTFTAVVLWENRRMLRLARRIFPDAPIACAAGSCELTIDLESWWAELDERMCG
jgi:RimJ/RimL family protein N-acetyltransferase